MLTTWHNILKILRYISTLTINDINNILVNCKERPQFKLTSWRWQYLDLNNNICWFRQILRFWRWYLLQYDFSWGRDHQEQEITTNNISASVTNLHARSLWIFKLDHVVVYWIDASNTLTWYLDELWIFPYQNVKISMRMIGIDIWNSHTLEDIIWFLNYCSPKFCFSMIFKFVSLTRCD